jgi:hypothetical protein
MNNNNIVNNDITVILNLYKRPHVLQEQINSIRNQTIKPKHIIIWKNYAINDSTIIDIPKEISQDKSIVIVDCNQNLGVWPRFLMGLLFNTEYVAVFDDDTIPGKMWFQNCITTINIYNGLLGSIGLIFNNTSGYYNDNYQRHGWVRPNIDTIQVDFVGHAWFFRRIWILELYKILPDYDNFLICGEDMGFSWALQQIGINTYVPPHPPNNIEMFGSIPELAWKYGNESIAISKDSNNLNKFLSMFLFYKNKGFKFITNYLTTDILKPNLNDNNILQGNSIDHLSFFLRKIINNQPFSLIRPGDGEYMIVNGISFSTNDKWSYTGSQILQKDLLLSIQSCKLLPLCYVGIPCSDCIKMLPTYSTKNISNIIDLYQLNADRITYANIFCNKNWKIFTDFLINTKIPIYYIGPGKENIHNLHIIDTFHVNELQIETWDIDKDSFTKNLYNWISNYINKSTVSLIFTFSIGPLSKIIIPYLCAKYSNHSFIDIGSSFDSFLKNDNSRGYLHNNYIYNKMICDFTHGHTFNENNIDLSILSSSDQSILPSSDLSILSSSDQSILPSSDLSILPSSDTINNLYNTENFIKQFEGGWSYSPNEMREFLKFLTIRDSYRVLEFGAGKSTSILYDVIHKYCKTIEYDTFEHDPQYKVTYKNVNTIMYDTENIDNVIIPNKLYDIILIDGPHGLLRSKWYYKIRNHLDYNTIMLIDDYNHFPEFETELNKHFNYTVLSLSDEPFRPYGEHSWRIITNITLNYIVI